MQDTPTKPAPPKKGDVVKGHVFLGGDPAVKENWKPDVPQQGDVRKGYQYLGGDPGKKESWAPVSQRPADMPIDPNVVGKPQAQVSLSASQGVAPGQSTPASSGSPTPLDQGQLQQPPATVQDALNNPKVRALKEGFKGYDAQYPTSEQAPQPAGIEEPTVTNQKPPVFAAGEGGWYKQPDGTLKDARDVRIEQDFQERSPVYATLNRPGSAQYSPEREKAMKEAGTWTAGDELRKTQAPLMMQADILRERQQQLDNDAEKYGIAQAEARMANLRDEITRMEQLSKSGQPIDVARFNDMVGVYNQQLERIRPFYTEQQDILAAKDYVKQKFMESEKAFMNSPEVKEGKARQEIMDRRFAAAEKDLDRNWISNGVIDQYVLSPMASTVTGAVLNAAAALGRTLDAVGNTINYAQGKEGYYSPLAEAADNLNAAARELTPTPSQVQEPLFDKNWDVNTRTLLPKALQAATYMGLLAGGGVSGGDVGLVGASYMTTEEDYYSEAIAAGMKPGQAQAFSMGAATLTSLLEGVSPGPFVTGKTVKGEMMARAINAIRDGKQWDAALVDATKYVLKEGAFEGMQEGLQAVGDDVSRAISNLLVGDDKLQYQSPQVYADNVMLGIAMGALSATAGRIADRPLHMQALDWAVRNRKKVEDFIKKNKFENSEELLSNLETISNIYEGNDLFAMKPEKSAKVASLIQQKDKVEQEVKEKPRDEVVASVSEDPRLKKAKELTDQIIKLVTPSDEEETDAAPSAEADGQDVRLSKAKIEAEAKRLGYLSARSFNTQNTLNENPSPEVAALLHAISEHHKLVIGKKEIRDLVSMDGEDFGLWAKTHEPARDGTGNLVREEEIPLAVLRIQALRDRGMNKLADTEEQQLRLSKKKENWTIDEWKSRHDEEISQGEVDEKNKEAESFNAELKKAQDKLVDGGEPVSSKAATTTKSDEEPDRIPTRGRIDSGDKAPDKGAAAGAVGNPQKQRVNEITQKILGLLEVKPEESEAAMVDTGAAPAPENTKAVTAPDGKVTLEEKPAAGETTKKKPTKPAAKPASTPDQEDGSVLNGEEAIKTISSKLSEKNPGLRVEEGGATGVTYAEHNGGLVAGYRQPILVTSKSQVDERLKEVASRMKGRPAEEVRMAQEEWVISATEEEQHHIDQQSDGTMNGAEEKWSALPKNVRRLVELLYDRNAFDDDAPKKSPRELWAEYDRMRRQVEAGSLMTEEALYGSSDPIANRLRQHFEPTTNEDQLAPKAPAAAQAEDTGTPASVPVGERPATEPVATDLTEDLPDDPKVLADAYYDDHQIWNSNANPEYAMINAMKGRVKESSYDEWGDPNDKGQQMAKTYFAKKDARTMANQGQTLDQIAQELTEELGREVSPDELAELMRANQSGLPRTSPRMRQTADRYKAITGKRLTSANGARNLKQKGKAAVKDSDTKDFIDQHTDQDGNVNWQGVKDNIHALGFLGYTDEQARELEAEADRQLAANAGGGKILAAVPEAEADAGRGADKERAVLEETLVGARKELEAYERYFKKQAESLFDKDAVESKKRGKVKRAEPSMFEAEGDTRANTAEDMEAGAKTLRDRVALAERALADYDAQAGARAQAAAQQTSIPTEKEPWQMTRDEFLDAATLDKEFRNQYAGRSSRTNPSETPIPKIGSWRISKSAGWNKYGDNIEQLREIPIDKIRGAEDPKQEGRQFDVERYAQFMQDGKKPPPISAAEIGDGTFRINDGHRRLAAHEIVGKKTILAWVSPSSDTGLREPSGKVIETDLTHQTAVKNALAEGNPVPAEVLADYPELKPQTPAQAEAPLPKAERAQVVKNLDAAIEKARARVRGQGNHPPEAYSVIADMVEQRDAIAAGKPFTVTDVTKDIIGSKELAGMVTATNKNGEGELIEKKKAEEKAAKQAAKKPVGEIHVVKPGATPEGGFKKQPEPKLEDATGGIDDERFLAENGVPLNKGPLTTKSGRVVTPPKQKGRLSQRLQQINEWLVDQALEEFKDADPLGTAKQRDNDYKLGLVKDMRGKDGKARLSQSDRTELNELLWSDKPTRQGVKAVPIEEEKEELKALTEALQKDESKEPGDPDEPELDEIEKEDPSLSEKDRDSIKILANKLAEDVRRIGNEIADKMGEPGMLSATFIPPKLIRAAFHGVAKAIEVGGDVVQAIKNGLERIMSSKWYRKLSEEDRQKADDEMAAEFARLISMKRFAELKNKWIGDTDFAAHDANVDAANIQDRIKATVPKQGVVDPGWAKRWQKVDQAILVYLDLKGNPEHLAQFADKLTPEQQEILNLSQNLTDAQKAIADEIRTKYDALAARAMDAGQITNALDDYVARFWDFKGQPAADIGRFKTSTRHKLRRSLGSILEGWAQGYDLRIKTASNALQAVSTAINQAIANKEFLKQGGRIAYGPQETPLFSTYKAEGYAPVDNEGFSKWDYAGELENFIPSPDTDLAQLMVKLKEYKQRLIDKHGEGWKEKMTDEDKDVLRILVDEVTAARQVATQLLGRDILVTPEGTVIKRSRLYAPKNVAKDLNAMLNPSALADIPAAQIYSRWSNAAKQSLFLTSLFHHQAFMRSHLLGGPMNKLGNMNLFQAYREGLQMIREKSPEVEQLVRAGLTVGRMQDFNELSEVGESWMKKHLDKMGVSQDGRTAISNLHKSQTRWLFEKFGAGMKTLDAVNDFRREVQRNRKLPAEKQETLDQIAQRVARLANQNYGGLNLKRTKSVFTGRTRSATEQQLWRWALLAPDWCVDAKTRALTKDGWKAYDQLSVGDEIMAFDPETRKYKWSALKDKYENHAYDGEMVKVANHSRAVMMTPDHKCYVYNFSKERHEVVLAKDLKSSHLIPRCGEPFDLPEVPVYSDHFVRIVGWMVTDGNFKVDKWKRKDGTYGTRTRAFITQAKPKTVAILKGMGISFYTTKTKDHDKFRSNYLCYKFEVDRGITASLLEARINTGLSWGFLGKLTRQQLQLLYDTMMLGDGTGQRRFCGKEREVSFMSMVQIMLGHSVTFHQQEKNCWITRSVTSKHIYVEKQGRKPLRVHYKGTIWCPSVDTGFWVAEREGLVFLTGNTESNLQMAADAFKAGKLGDYARRSWARVIVRGAATWAAFNLLMALFPDPDDPEDEALTPLQRMNKRFDKAWNEGHLRWTMWDVTPIFHALGGDPKKRIHYSIFGHFTDPLKIISTDHNGRIDGPIKFASSKLNPAGSRPALDLLKGSDWKNERFTTLDELVGLDDKGKYKRDIQGHKEGDINPDTGLPYKRDQQSHMAGDEKGGKLKWRLTGTKFGEEGPVSAEELPSWALNSVRGVLPTQVQNAEEWATGERDGVYAIMQSLGLGVHMSTDRPVEEEKPAE